jgi:rod shape-determining protein MreB
MEIKARDLSTGVPKAVSVGSQEIREAFHEALSAILESIRLTMARCPPGFSADLAEQGIVLAGGGARLRGLDRLVARETCLPVQIAQARKTSQ